MGKNSRPPLLSALCILSFTGNGLAFLVYLLATVKNQEAIHWIGKWSAFHEPSGLTPVYFFIFVLLYAISFSGVMAMWRLKKQGFWIYLVSQSAILVHPVLWLGIQAFSPVALIFTFLYISLYATQIRKIKCYSLEA